MIRKSAMNKLRSLRNAEISSDLVSVLGKKAAEALHRQFGDHAQDAWENYRSLENDEAHEVLLEVIENFIGSHAKEVLEDVTLGDLTGFGGSNDSLMGSLTNLYLEHVTLYLEEVF